MALTDAVLTASTVRCNGRQHYRIAGPPV